jgi:prepilin-type N-terminal cleavage/methylation domain-containing protein
MRTDSPLRGAFTLAEILVALAIIAIMGAAVVPTIRGRLTVASANALGGELQGLQQAILAFRTNIGRYPQNLRYLTYAPSGATKDICNNAITGTNFLNYRGPYVTRDIGSTNYVVAENDTVNVLLTRSPTSPNSAVKEYLQITVTGVDKKEADILERQYDPTFDYTSGTIVWTQNFAGTQGALTYQIPITNC